MPQRRFASPAFARMPSINFDWIENDDINACPLARLRALLYKRQATCRTLARWYYSARIDFHSAMKDLLRSARAASSVR
jgi:hypothetical protein